MKMNDVLSKVRPILDSEKAIVIQDLDSLEHSITELKQSFGNEFQHCFAVKANPIMGVLETIVSNGLGLECASQEEVHLALAAGCNPDLVLHDGPAKTRAEIDECLSLGIRLILNDSIEVNRTMESSELEMSTSSIAVRVNPLIGYGSNLKTSVSVPDSKFGIPLNESNEILNLYQEHQRLNGIHIHPGSQGIALERMIESVRRIMEITTEIEASRDNRLDWIDIGGGMAFDYQHGRPDPGFREYADGLQREVPDLFDGRKILTEFGRSLVAGSAAAVSKVEKVWRREGLQNILIHLGSDLFIRWALNPDDWHHRITSDIEGEKEQTIVHGPLCYNGDRLGSSFSLPHLKEGDFVFIHDVGAYTMSMWSGHCNRIRPRVVGIQDGGVRTLLKPWNTESIIAMWSA